MQSQPFTDVNPAMRRAMAMVALLAMVAVCAFAGCAPGHADRNLTALQSHLAVARAEGKQIAPLARDIRSEGKGIRSDLRDIQSDEAIITRILRGIRLMK